MKIEGKGWGEICTVFENQGSLLEFHRHFVGARPMASGSETKMLQVTAQHAPWDFAHIGSQLLVPKS